MSLLTQKQTGSADFSNWQEVHTQLFYKSYTFSFQKTQNI